MPSLSPEDEQQILRDLTALGWTRELDARSMQVITERLGCSPEDAGLILQQLQDGQKITMASESGATPAPGRKPDSDGWRWVRR